MIYIIVLNWKGADDTIACIDSILKSKYEDYRIVIVDNFSPDDSYSDILDQLSHNARINSKITELDKYNFTNYICDHSDKIVMIQSGANLGYAGGNNVGLKFALSQDDMEFVWILNNDTEITSNALSRLVDKCRKDSNIGICGSRLIFFHDRGVQQSIGGVHNKWLCTNKQFGFMQPTTYEYNDDDVINNIDYIVGAAMFINRNCLLKTGLLSEDYFLYFEELDYCLRAQKQGFKLALCSESHVFHKEGASTNGGTSLVADYCSIANRLKITKKFYPMQYLTVWLSLFFVLFNRIKRSEFNKAIICGKIIFGCDKNLLENLIRLNAK